VKRSLPAGLLAAAVLWSGAALGQPIEELDYQRIDPARPTATARRIEVIEFFYYGCESCDRFEPRLKAWLARQPDDVAFRRLPAIRRTEWIPLTRIFFVLEALGALPRLHGEVYRALHAEGLDLSSGKVLLDWAASKGLDRGAFETTLLSDRIAIEVQRARDTTIAYGVSTTPTVVVDGRYLTSAGMLGDLDLVLPVVDALVDMARRDRAASTR
jgi:thiol:disulfide interchange protein DsbA